MRVMPREKRRGNFISPGTFAARIVVDHLLRMRRKALCEPRLVSRTVISGNFVLVTPLVDDGNFHGAASKRLEIRLSVLIRCFVSPPPAASFQRR